MMAGATAPAGSCVRMLWPCSWQFDLKALVSEVNGHIHTLSRAQLQQLWFLGGRCLPLLVLLTSLTHLWGKHHQTLGSLHFSSLLCCSHELVGSSPCLHPDIPASLRNPRHLRLPGLGRRWAEAGPAGWTAPGVSLTVPVLTCRLLCRGPLEGGRTLIKQV